MTNQFKDITVKLGKPNWYDQNGYPRYCKFHPDRFSNIYVDYVALVLITCQRCKRTWRVAVGVRNYITREIYLNDVLKSTLSDKIEFPSRTDIGSFHYGDPPNHMQECHAGSTMNSIPLQVIEFWKRNREKQWSIPVHKIPRWVRVKKYERKIKVDWLNA